MRHLPTAKQAGVLIAASFFLYGFFYLVSPGPVPVPFSDVLQAWGVRTFDANGTIGQLQIDLDIILSSDTGLLAAGDRIRIRADLEYSVSPSPATPLKFLFYFREVNGSHVSVFPEQCTEEPARFCTFPELGPVVGKPDRMSLDQPAWFPVGGDYIWVLSATIDDEFLHFQGNASNRGEGFIGIEPRSISLQNRANRNQERFNGLILGLAFMAASTSVVLLFEKLDELLRDRKGKMKQSGGSRALREREPRSRALSADPRDQRAKERTSTPWWANPVRFLPLLFFGSSIAVLYTWDLQKRQPDLAVLNTLSLALLTASFGTTIAMATYRWLNIENQRRQWRHEVEVRHFEQIYGPLYEDLRRIVNELEEYKTPWITKWPEIKEKSFGPFVEPGIAEALDRLKLRLDALSKVGSSTYATPVQLVDRVTASSPWSAKLSNYAGLFKQRFTEGQGFKNFFYNPRVMEPAPHIVEAIQRIFSKAGVAEAEVPAYLKQVKSAFLDEPSMKERVTLTEEIKSEAQETLARVRRRMMHPFG